MKNLNKLALSALILSQVISPAFAANVTISGSTLQILGTISTCVENGGKKTNLTTIGWILIIVGTVNDGAAAPASELNTEGSFVTGFTQFDKDGKGITDSKKTVSAPLVLESVEMEAFLAGERAKLSGSGDLTNGTLAIDQFSKALGSPSNSIPNLITQSKSFADGLTNGERFASTHMTVSRASIAQQFDHVLSSQDYAIISHYLGLRNIQLQTE